MMHDPDVYANPMEFQPERFLGEHPAPDPNTLAFGFGRRVCPGRFLADKTVFLSVAQSLAVFDINKPRQDGVEVTTPRFDPGVISHPAPFQCEIKARTPELEALILSVEQDHPWEESGAADLQKVGY
jgi:cytochrome P450